MTRAMSGRRLVRRVVTVATLVSASLVVPLVAAPPAGAATPSVAVDTIADNLTYPWDIAPMPGGGALLGLRPGGFRYLDQGDVLRPVAADTSDVYVKDEAGQLGVVLDPQFATTRNFYVCQAYQANGRPVDIRVVKWQLSADNATATRVRTLLTGIPINTGTAFHNGCRLRFAPDGTLHVGTGDAGSGPAPQSLTSLGGKTLRISPVDGSAPVGNPFRAQGGPAALVWTYGHRNVQGLAVRPGSTQVWSVEHGPDRDDEVNLLSAGGNYGWGPTKDGTSYDQSVPMTDTARYPAAIAARWKSGSPTVAPSGATFLTGSKWGRWENALAVGELKNTGVRILTMTPDGRVTRTEQLPQLDNTYGRIRAVEAVPGGNAMYVITSNGSGDRLLRVRATAAQPAYRAGVDPSPSGVAAVPLGSALATFVRGTDGRIYTARQSGPGRAWSGFSAVTTAVASAPAAVSTDGKTVELFARASNGHLLHASGSGTSFGRWRDLGGVISTAPAVASLKSGSVDVVARAGGDDALYRLRLTGSVSSGWKRVGGALAGAPAIGADRGTGRLVVRGRGTGGQLCTLLATATTTGAWSCAGGRETWAAPGITQGAAPVTVTRGADLTPVVATATGFVTAIGGTITGASAIAARSGGGFAVLGRGSDNALWCYDGRPGVYSWSRIGGTLS